VNDTWKALDINTNVDAIVRLTRENKNLDINLDIK